MKVVLAAGSLVLVGVSIVVAAYRPGAPAAYVCVYAAFTVVWCMLVHAETE